MFNRNDYCQRYFMRKEAGLVSALYNIGGNALSTAGKFITKHFGDGKYLSQAGNKLSSWGNNFTIKGDALRYLETNGLNNMSKGTVARPSGMAKQPLALPPSQAAITSTAGKQPIAALPAEPESLRGRSVQLG